MNAAAALEPNFLVTVRKVNALKKQCRDPALPHLERVDCHPNSTVWSADGSLITVPAGAPQSPIPKFHGDDQQPNLFFEVIHATVDGMLVFYKDEILRLMDPTSLPRRPRQYSERALFCDVQRITWKRGHQIQEATLVAYFYKAITEVTKLTGLSHTELFLAMCEGNAGSVLGISM